MIPAVAKLNRYAAAHGIPVISTTDAHSENDPEFRDWPAHCVVGTTGQQKVAATILERRVVIPTEPGTYGVAGAQQIILEKHTLEAFSNPNLPGILDELNAERCVVYGAFTEYCVRCAIAGLLRIQKPVEIITDAVESLDPVAGRKILDDFQAAGCRLRTAAEIVQS